MTERLYYADSYLRSFRAQVVEVAGDGLTVYLDRTAFYPASGGQPCDTGSIAGRAVLDVVDEGERIAHRLSAPLDAGVADCAIDWERRFDHMQQHSGQHLLSAVFAGAFALRTASFHLGADSATIDLEGGPVDPPSVREAERRANAVVFENRPLAVEFEDAAAASGLRKPSEREGTLRIVSIAGLDRSACGGTHVRSTGEIGPILIRKIEKVRETTRVEFVCGGRAIRRARADFEALSAAAQLFSVSLDDLPAIAAAHLETARAADKARRKLELELATFQGRELYAATAPDADGLRRHTRRLERGGLDELRALAQSFTGQPKSVFVAALDDPPSVLLAASADSGIDAGKLLKAALAQTGGRGGGSSRIAQGSVAHRELLDRVLEKL
ncbi:MAG: alanyl-tRNA editing protein [Bryobacteraceae bacterium]|jgi:alanyl-tRNA synthetase